MAVAEVSNGRRTSVRPVPQGPDVIARRLLPGVDLKSAIDQLADEHDLRAGTISTAVGSLSSVRLRLAGAATFLERREHFEIVSVTGTVSTHGSHVHISVADAEGRTFGGHLTKGCEVRTTVELVVSAVAGVEFVRELDEATGFDELKVIDAERDA